MKEDDDTFLKTFVFIKEIKAASKYELKLTKDEDLNYVCDCSSIPNYENIENNLDSMKKTFDSMTQNENKVLYYQNFKNFLEKAGVHKNIINLVIDYLKKKTQRDYCIFNDIKYLFTNLNYSLSLNDKKVFLFKMILKIYNQDNKLNNEQINKYINIDYD